MLGYEYLCWHHKCLSGNDQADIGIGGTNSTKSDENISGIFYFYKTKAMPGIYRVRHVTCRLLYIWQHDA